MHFIVKTSVFKFFKKKTRSFKKTQLFEKNPGFWEVDGVFVGSLSPCGQRYVARTSCKTP